MSCSWQTIVIVTAAVAILGNLAMMAYWLIDPETRADLLNIWKIDFRRIRSIWKGPHR